ncbi:protein translocase subunit SecD [Psittacicella melopsittaci]|uniref:Protein translocase subunit SecD n=1 Tax=Psittacicella melopsittaci TaxID=2028576 RepID=A0A3A1Y7T4_9GAMM|nr:protein translocase subunit SecD [Psittacicella melopsittaci]RIY33289.1 protein translocase subunit SecD [Psittacicella melopsittaci]
MQNHYPLWKNLLIVFTIIVGCIYALPNLFPEKPSLQIAGSRGREIELAAYNQIQQRVEQAGITISKSTFKDGKVNLVFESDDDQQKAAQVLDSSLGDNYTTALSYTPATPAWLTTIGAQPMKLGLDLRGGVRFLMEVDINTLLDRNYDSLAKFIRDQARQQGISLNSVTYNSDRKQIEIAASSTDAVRALNSYLHGSSGMGTEVQTQTQGLNVFVTYTSQKYDQTVNYAVEQSLLILRNRVTEIGVAEPVIQRQGDTNIIVELPGIHDVARAKEIIGATATLSFNLVNTNVTQQQIAANLIPVDTMVVSNAAGQKYALYRNDIISGQNITDASAGRAENGGPQVSIRLDSEGARLISEATKTAIGRPMATVYSEYKDTGRRDAEGKPILRKVDEVANVATIQARLGASFVITGLSSMAEANNLALVLRSGALVAPIQIISEKVIGPSLGAANIEQGLFASISALICTILIMTLVYRFFGFIAGFVLIFNVVLLIAALSILPGTTLTMPGIAGIVLTIGMSIDANVLIYSRIIDELRIGRSPQAAMAEGYRGAWTSIFDANITSILTALILFVFGTGPIKGFAITLALGVLISMFTAIVASRMIFNMVYGSRKATKLHI